MYKYSLYIIFYILLSTQTIGQVIELEGVVGMNTEYRVHHSQSPKIGIQVNFNQTLYYGQEIRLSTFIKHNWIYQTDDDYPYWNPVNQFLYQQGISDYLVFVPFEFSQYVKLGLVAENILIIPDLCSVGPSLTIQTRKYHFILSYQYMPYQWRDNNKFSCRIRRVF